MKNHPKLKKFDWSVLSTAEHIHKMFEVKVKFERDVDFTLAHMSLPIHLTEKIKITHEWNGEKFMVCQAILTEEMTSSDLVFLVQGIMTWLNKKDAEDFYDYKEHTEKETTCQNLKNVLNEKITPILESKDPQRRDCKE